MDYGIYIHVPFCQRRCIYCDFYSTTYGKEERERYVEALCREMELRRDYIGQGNVGSIYLGGGTPSTLCISQIEKIMEHIGRLFHIKADAEITMEANPDDVTEDFARGLRGLAINRMSLGVQSFDDEMLRLLKRRHTGSKAMEAVETLKRHGMDNISIDLIYGLPEQTLEEWTEDVRQALDLPISHLSAYSLMYEEGTQLWEMKERGVVAEADEEVSLGMFRRLMEMTKERGWEHYEISNFALPTRRSRHNSGYWQEMHYLGLGPAAHSYDGKSRWWNTEDLKEYLKAQGNTKEKHLHQAERLTPDMRFNERLLKRLRTQEGLDLEEMERDFGEEYRKGMLKRAKLYLQTGVLAMHDGKLRITEDGIFISNCIISDLMTETE